MNDAQRTGYVAPGFESVAAAFYQTVPRGAHSGSALSIWLGGNPVVELFAGTADETARRTFGFDTLVNVFSCTKGMASLLVAMLVEEGALPGYDTPLADIWPEFATHGKGRISIGDALAHRAGVSEPPFVLASQQILDPLEMADLLAGMQPLWAPGTAHQYHGITHGALTAKLVHIATGRDIGSVFAERIATPLDADVWIGLPVSEHARVARLLPDESPQAAPAPSAEATANPFEYLSGERWSDPAVREAQIPGAGGIATASGLARVWSAAVVPTIGVRLLGDANRRLLRHTRSHGPAVVPGPPPYQAWGAGVMVPSGWDPYLTEDSIGHDGAGGQLAFADPQFGVGFAYVTNQMGNWARAQSVLGAFAAAVR